MKNEETKESSTELLEQMAQEEFEANVKPVMKWLSANHHPDTEIIINCGFAKMVNCVRTIDILNKHNDTNNPNKRYKRA